MKQSCCIAGMMIGLLLQPVQVSAASPYDAYYDNYQLPENTPAPSGDNDSYYSAPVAYPTDNDVYYTAPGAYEGTYAPKRDNCNTIGEMPSCGSD